MDLLPEIPALLVLTDDEATAQLMAAHSKDALASYARSVGAWSGDDARTSKELIARAVLAHYRKGNPRGDEPAFMPREVKAPAPIPDHRDPVTGLRIPDKLDELHAQQRARDLAMVNPYPEGAAPKPAAVANATTIAKAIADALGGVKLGADPEEIRAIVRDELQGLQPAKIVIRDGTPAVKLDEHCHPMFEKVLRLVEAGLNVYLVGEAAVGKSHLAKQIAKALGRKFGTLHCSAGVSESQVTGWLLPTGEQGKFQFVPSQFARLYVDNDTLFLIDEIARADANMLTVLNGALANGALHIPQCPERPEWIRGQRVGIIAADNTTGQGADALYVAAAQLDAATLDRLYIVLMDYDADREHKLCGLPYTPGAAWKAAPAPTPQEIAALGQWVLDLRAKVKTAKLRRVVGRTLQKALDARCAGIPTEEVKKDILAGWTRDELSKVGELR